MNSELQRGRTRPSARMRRFLRSTVPKSHYAADIEAMRQHF